MNQSFTVEFSQNNKARLILPKPVKVNSVHLVELLESSKALSYCLVVTFYNQVTEIVLMMIQINLYRVTKSSFELIRAIVVDDVTEDLQDVAFNSQSSQLFFAGEKGIIYSQFLGNGE